MREATDPEDFILNSVVKLNFRACHSPAKAAQGESTMSRDNLGWCQVTVLVITIQGVLFEVPLRLDDEA